MLKTVISHFTARQFEPLKSHHISSLLITSARALCLEPQNKKFGSKVLNIPSIQRFSAFVSSVALVKPNAQRIRGINPTKITGAQWLWVNRPNFLNTVWSLERTTKAFLLPLACPWKQRDILINVLRKSKNIFSAFPLLRDYFLFFKIKEIS